MAKTTAAAMTKEIAIPTIAQTGVHLATLQVVGEDQEVGGTAGQVVGNTHEAGEHSADGTADKHTEHGATEAHEDTEERRLGERRRRWRR